MHEWCRVFRLVIRTQHDEVRIENIILNQRRKSLLQLCQFPRPDTIRCIVASLVGDGESGDSLVDENEPIQPLQQAHVDDYGDPNWEPEPIDAGPGKFNGVIERDHNCANVDPGRISRQQTKRHYKHARQHLRFQRALCEGATSPVGTTFACHHRWKLRPRGTSICRSRRPLLSLRYHLSVASKYRDSQNPLRGSSTAGLRSDVEGHDRLQAYRPSYTSAGPGQ